MINDISESLSNSEKELRESQRQYGGVHVGVMKVGANKDGDLLAVYVDTGIGVDSRTIFHVVEGGRHTEVLNSIVSKLDELGIHPFRNIGQWLRAIENKLSSSGHC